MPKRIQRRRERGWRMPEGARYVGRGSRWGNPFYLWPQRHSGTVFGQPWGLITEPLYMPSCVSAHMYNDVAYVTCSDRDAAIRHAAELFRRYCANRQREIPAQFARWLNPLRGKDLACWCPLVDEHGNRIPCHADVLLELANQEAAR